METTLISWRDVTLCYGQCGSDAVAIGRDDPRRVRLLREYRATGAMRLGWLCTPAELDAASDDDATELGPAPEAIDWAGLDEDDAWHECAYCRSTLEGTAPDPKGMTAADWEREGSRHGDGCEWITTRAFTRDAAAHG